MRAWYTSLDIVPLWISTYVAQTLQVQASWLHGISCYFLSYLVFVDLGVHHLTGLESLEELKVNKHNELGVSESHDIFLTLHGALFVR